MFLLFLAFLSLAQAEMKRLVVLEFTGGEVEKTMLMLFSNDAQAEIIKLINRNEMMVMTQESMMMIFDDMEKNEACAEGSCEMRIARNIGADYVVTGNLVRYGADYILVLKLYDAQMGALLASSIAEPQNIQDLRKSTADLSQQLLVEGIGLSDKPSFSGDSENWISSNQIEASFGAQADQEYHSTISSDQVKEVVDHPLQARSSNKIVAERDNPKPKQELKPEEKISEIKLASGRSFSQAANLGGENYKAVLIPAGSFTMGCSYAQNFDCNYDEETVYNTSVSRDFYMMQSEVTQRLYQEILGEKPSHFKGKNRPVENVSWYDAVQFANSLSLREGLELCYSISGENVEWNNKDCNGWRLPTEAEWEYAARGPAAPIASAKYQQFTAGGSSSYKYSGSNEPNSAAWYGDNSKEKTHKVCEKQKNGYGLCDMSGNVWEWCWDWYKVSLEEGYEGPDTGAARVNRGGSWYDGARYTRVSERDRDAPEMESSQLGFRLVRFP